MRPKHQETLSVPESEEATNKSHITPMLISEIAREENLIRNS